ncbi:MAG TPA: DUF6504 family protein [Candidatus Lustribacter sp.]|nr:DUF6504 family protein [Candidatus Lustribacter sp.]
MRRYCEPIEVLPDEHGQPVRFIWHGRLYLVLAVLGHWRERRAWWREVLDPVLDPVPTRRGGAPDDGAAADGAPSSVATVERALDPTERLVWRVEASVGRLGNAGVYDLALEPAGLPGGPGQWQLLRVSD